MSRPRVEPGDERVLRVVRSVAGRAIDFTYGEAHHLMERACYRL
ncbi:hypothetical protein ACGFJC_08495 [Nonomuraea fuscirosea]